MLKWGASREASSIVGPLVENSHQFETWQFGNRAGQGWSAILASRGPTYTR